MNTQDKIAKEAKSLPDEAAREVLDFIGYLKSKVATCNKAEADEKADWAEFEKLAGSWTGRFDRSESYDDPRFR